MRLSERRLNYGREVSCFRVVFDIYFGIGMGRISMGCEDAYPDGEVVTMHQEYFCSGVAVTNDLKLLRWVREEKECAWDYRTSGAAAYQGNLDMLKYCCENGCEVGIGTYADSAQYSQLAFLEYLRSKSCPWTKEVCKRARENNHIDCLTYAVKNKCPGFEAYEQFIPKQ